MLFLFLQLVSMALFESPNEQETNIDHQNLKPKFLLIDPLDNFQLLQLRDKRT